MRTHLLAILSANSVSAAVTGAYVQWSGGGDVRFLSPWLDGFGALSAGTAVGLHAATWRWTSEPAVPLHLRVDGTELCFSFDSTDGHHEGLHNHGNGTSAATKGSNEAEDGAKIALADCPASAWRFIQIGDLGARIQLEGTGTSEQFTS